MDLDPDDAYRPGWISETELVIFVEMVLRASGRSQVIREASVGPHQRVDLLIDGPIAQLIEVKITTPQTMSRLAAMVEQLRSYGASFERHHGKPAQLILLTPGTLSEDHLAFLRKNQILGYDKQWLLDSAREVGLEGEAEALLESRRPKDRPQRPAANDSTR